MNAGSSMPQLLHSGKANGLFGCALYSACAASHCALPLTM